MKLAIIFGGASFEHEISIVSAITVKSILNYIPIFIFLDDEHNFYLIDEKDMNAGTFSSGSYKKMKHLSLSHGGFEFSGMFGSKKLDVSAVLNLVHGSDGEDGTLASLFDFFKIRYIGPRVEASMVSFNKVMTKAYAESIGIKTLDYEVLYRGGTNIVKTPLPVIIKPARLGSSIGVSIVKVENELEYALDSAFEYDDTILIEPFIAGVNEYNLAGCKTDKFTFSMVEEPQKNEFLDFEKKYMDFSRTSAVSKADISESLEKRIKETFEKIYDPIFIGSLIRCDFFEVDGEVYLNEINPIPGSMAHYLFDDFNSVIDDVLENLPRKDKISTGYDYIHSISSAKGK